MKIDGRTKLYGIIGDPVAYSLSPVMHNAAFAAQGENRVYLPFPAPDAAAALAGMRALSIHGVSVTLPHKQAVIDLLDEIDPMAARIGAVNAIILRQSPDGGTILYGTNTDWLGANRALAGKIELAGSRAVILGAGGAARAIGFGLLEAGAQIELCSRTETKGRALADLLDCPWQPLKQAGTAGADILINATSVGMLPHEQVSPVPHLELGRFKVVMDIVYAPLQTVLLKAAAAAGCGCVNGLEMLLYQGIAQYELWTERLAPVEVMRAALLQASGNAAEAAELPGGQTSGAASNDVAGTTR